MKQLRCPGGNDRSEGACKLMQMDGMKHHGRRRRKQFLLILCALAILFAADYMLLMSALHSK